MCYAKVESVPLALQVLDGSCLRATASSSDKPLKVTKAEFTVKGSAYDPAKRTKVHTTCSNELYCGCGERQRVRV